MLDGLIDGLIHSFNGYWGIQIIAVTMGKTEETLLQILRAALCSEPIRQFQSDVNWEEVFQLSNKNGVVAIAFDGITRSRETYTSAMFPLDDERWEDLKYKWLGYSLDVQKNNKCKMRVLSEVANILYNKGVRILILKGYTLSIDYPNPSIRPLGDIDFYVLGQNKDGALNADRFLSATLDVKVTKSIVSYHSHCVYQGVSIENHYELCNTYWHRGKTLYLEKKLRQLADENCKPHGPINIPSADFNAVFLVWHMASHFCNGKAIVRQLCDWGVFLKTERNNINWSKVVDIWKESGLYVFAAVINGVAVDYIGLDPQYVPCRSNDTRLKQKVLMSFLSKPEPSALLYKIFQYFKNSWKYRLTSGHSGLHFLINSGRLHLFHSNDLVEVPLSEDVPQRPFAH